MDIIQKPSGSKIVASLVNGVNKSCEADKRVVELGCTTAKKTKHEVEGFAEKNHVLHQHGQLPTRAQP